MIFNHALGSCPDIFLASFGWHLFWPFALLFFFAIFIFYFFSRISCGFLRINNFRAFVARDVRKKRKKQYILVEFLSLRSFYSSQCGIPNISFQILIQIPFFCFPLCLSFYLLSISLLSVFIFPCSSSSVILFWVALGSEI